MREVLDAFYRERTIANHHIASYNDFLDRRLQEIMDSTRIGEGENLERGYIHTEIEGYRIKVGKIRIGRPIVREATGDEHFLTPMEARLRDLTYEAPVYVEFIPEINGIPYEPEEVRIGYLPIMVKSKKCNISRGSSPISISLLLYSSSERGLSAHNGKVKEVQHIERGSRRRGGKTPF